MDGRAGSLRGCHGYGGSRGTQGRLLGGRRGRRPRRGRCNRSLQRADRLDKGRGGCVGAVTWGGRVRDSAFEGVDDLADLSGHGALGCRQELHRLLWLIWAMRSVLDGRINRSRAGRVRPRSVGLPIRSGDEEGIPDEGKRLGRRIGLVAGCDFGSVGVKAVLLRDERRLRGLENRHERRTCRVAVGRGNRHGKGVGRDFLSGQQS